MALVKHNRVNMPIRFEGGHAPSRAEEAPGARPGKPAYTSCSSEPSFFSTFFSPASIGTAKRFCFGGIGQLNA